MPKVSPWHSSAAGIDVYHDNTACTEGNNIEKKHWTSGTGGKRKCSKCEEYDKAGK
jgi:phenylacetate-coenzyme A ligase PaaK-like adenylate-forming protein